jgi:anti-sigma factor RsiW
VNERDPGGDDVLSAYLDGELVPVERAELEARLAADPDARAERDEVSEVRTLVRGLAPPTLPAGFLDDLLTAVGADEAAACSSAAVLDLDAHRARRRPHARMAAAVATAAAAVAIVVAVAVPSKSATKPALATDVRVHQAGSAASGDPVSGLAPLAGPLRFGR